MWHVVKYLVMSKVTLNWGWHVIIYTTKNKMEKIYLLPFFCKDLFIGQQDFVVGYSKAPEQPQSRARPICHSHVI